MLWFLYGEYRPSAPLRPKPSLVRSGLALLGRGLTSVGTSKATEPNFSVFPNPTTGHFTVTNPSQEMLGLVVFDLMGRVVLQQSFAQNGQLDISGFPAGIYAYTLIKGGDPVKTGKIVKE